MAKVFHFRSLTPDQGCRISQEAAKCRDGAMVGWYWAGRKDSNSKNSALMPFFSTTKNTWSHSGLNRGFCGTKPVFLNDPHEKCFKEITPPPKKKRIEELNDRLVRLICYKVSRMLAFQTVFCTFSCYNINTLHNQFFMTLWELPTVQIKNVSSRNIHEDLPTALLTQL